MDKNTIGKKGIMSFDTFRKKEEFEIMLNDFLDSQEGLEILKLYYDNVYKAENSDMLEAHNNKMMKLRDIYNAKSDKLNGELKDLEKTIDDKKKILEYIEEEITRKELAQHYLDRNDVFKGRKNTLEERIEEKKKEIHEAKVAKDELMTESANDVNTLKNVTELTGAQELAFCTYNKSKKHLVEIKRLVSEGVEFEKGLERLGGLDRSKIELITKGVKKLEEGRTKVLTVADMVEHLYK